MKKDSFKMRNHKCQIYMPISTIQEIQEKAKQSEMKISKFMYQELTKVYPDKND